MLAATNPVDFRHAASRGHRPRGPGAPSLNVAERQPPKNIQRSSSDDALHFWLSPGQPIDELSAQCSPMAAETGASESSPLRALTVIHFTRLSEYQAQQQGRTLALSSPSWLVSGALVLASNDGPSGPATPPRGIDLHLGAGAGLSDAQLLRAASYYPQRWKSVLRSADKKYSTSFLAHGRPAKCKA